MTITIDLAQDVEERVRAQASARGVPVEEYVEGLVREGPRWLFYYGAADTRVGLAEAFTRDVVPSPSPSPKR